jgi:hypothetical protein
MAFICFHLLSFHHSSSTQIDTLFDTATVMATPSSPSIKKRGPPKCVAIWLSFAITTFIYHIHFALQFERSQTHWKVQDLWLYSVPREEKLNPIAIENRHAGTSDWTLTKPALNREVEGYMSHTSVQRGQSILLFYNSKSLVKVEVFRTGWYNGLGARRYFGPVSLDAMEQNVPGPDEFGMVACRWKDPYVIHTNVCIAKCYILNLVTIVVSLSDFASFQLPRQHGLQAFTSLGLQNPSSNKPTQSSLYEMTIILLISPSNFPPTHTKLTITGAADHSTDGEVATKSHGVPKGEIEHAKYPMIDLMPGVIMNSPLMGMGLESI